MKKVFLILGCVVTLVLLSSCTDNTDELLDRNEQNINKDEVVPGDRG